MLDDVYLLQTVQYNEFSVVDLIYFHNKRFVLT